MQDKPRNGYRTPQERERLLYKVKELILQKTPYNVIAALCDLHPNTVGAMAKELGLDKADKKKKAALKRDPDSLNAFIISMKKKGREYVPEVEQDAKKWIGLI